MPLSLNAFPMTTLSALRRQLPLDSALLGLLLGTVALHACFLLWPLPAGAPRDWISNLIFLPPFLLGAALNFRAARRHPRQRLAWRCFGWAQLSWVAGQIIYTALDLRGGGTPFPSVADLFFIGLLPLFMLGLLSLYRRQDGLRLFPFVVLDSLIVVGSLAGAYWAAATARSLAQSSGHNLSVLVALAYPLSDLLMLTLLLVLATWRPAAFATPASFARSAGLLLLLVADALYQVRTGQHSYQLGQGMDLLWTCGALALGLSAWLADWPSVSQTLAAWWARVARFLQHALPYLGLGVALSLAVIHYLHPVGTSPGVMLTAFFVVGLSALRQLATQREERALHERLDRQASHDTLTGLLNRAELLRRMHAAISRATAQGESLAVLFIDLDAFKTINDIHGHEVGDAVLREVSRRLCSGVRQSDLVGRLGGDEFVVVLSRLPDLATLRQIGQRLLTLLGQPVRVEGRWLPLSCSIGVTLCPAEAADELTALKNADFAMYQAKRRGRNNLQFFDPALHVQSAEQHELEVQLAGALPRGELSLAFQPLVDLASRRVVAAEALLRWRSPLLGEVPPARFIPVAEESGLIVEIGNWVLRQAARQLRRWHDAGHSGLTVAVNVSPLQFERDDFIEQVGAALVEGGLPGRALCLELTEGALIRNLAASNVRLERLRALGVKVALDDFGTGYSSLAYLRELRVDSIKVDRSFIRAMCEDGEVLVEAIINIAHHFGLSTVAEGIEEAGQHRALLELACDVGQGYLFSRPVPPEALELLLADSGGQLAPPAAD